MPENVLRCGLSEQETWTETLWKNARTALVSGRGALKAGYTHLVDKRNEVEDVATAMATVGMGPLELGGDGLGEGVVLENWISCRRNRYLTLRLLIKVQIDCIFGGMGDRLYYGLQPRGVKTTAERQRGSQFEHCARTPNPARDLRFGFVVQFFASTLLPPSFHHSDFQLPDSHSSIMGLYNSTCLTPTRELLNLGCTRSQRHRRLVGRATGVATAHGAQDKAAEAQRHFVGERLSTETVKARQLWRLASTQRAVFKDAAPRTPQTCPGALAIMDPQVTGVEVRGWYSGTIRLRAIPLSIHTHGRTLGVKRTSSGLPCTS
ncbi:hypothetical protein BJ912DRAFT_1047565 [Pholiota molesta]|nr:hypothetical protein BJ912DRAFT_1047565 [Pholiota molesta]